MRGIDLSRAYFEEIGLPMLRREFPEYLDRIAVGLVGHGSECFGYDDEISRDHDYEPGFCIWITEEDDRIFGFKLLRAYEKLPKAFRGIEEAKGSLGGKSAVGLRTVEDFYSDYTGRRGAPETLEDWLYTPSHYLAEATNGEVFYDPLGVFSNVRERIKNGMPADVRLKKLASCVLHMAQAGQYNYKRCIAHEEHAAARFALDEFARNTAEAVFLLERQHMPYYKWCFRAMRDLPALSYLGDKLQQLLLLPADETLRIELLIEEICHEILMRLCEEEICEKGSDYLEPHAYAINHRIRDFKIKNLPIFL